MTLPTVAVGDPVTAPVSNQIHSHVNGACGRQLFQANGNFVVPDGVRALAQVPTQVDPVFGLEVPVSCPEVPAELLQPRNTWADKAAYDEKARKVAQLFRENFKKYEAQASAEVRGAGPKI